MTPTEYFDNEPSEEDELDIDKLRKTIYSEFMSDLEMVASIARAFPAEWQLDIILAMMRDI